MKVRVTYSTPQMNVDETLTGVSPDDVVAQMKRAVCSRLGFALRLAVSAMTPTHFAQEVVRRYNAATGRSVPIPASCAEFIEVAREEGILTVLES